MEIFGYELKKKGKESAMVPSIVPPTGSDGSTVLSAGMAGYYGAVYDIEGTIKTENDLIRRYRDVAMYPDCASAIEDIVNEAIAAVDDEISVKINLDLTKMSDGLKNKITEEFNTVLDLLQFNTKGHEHFKNWYIDGRIYFTPLIDPNNPKVGIQEIRFIDPRKMKKVKNVKKRKTDKGVEVVEAIEEFYIYNDRGFVDSSNSSGIKMTKDSVIYVSSGLMDSNSNLMMGYLHKAIKPVNQLKMLEDALIIYRVSRAPERRIFYIDVGNLPKFKAEQYVSDIMNRFRNKITYDPSTGEIKDDRKYMSMLEDFWMPRREGGKGTEITTLQGGTAFNGMTDDLAYFQNKLYQSLNVPLSRMRESSGFTLGKSQEITRDEVKFHKFISRMRKKFSELFYESLRIQLLSKGIMTQEDWDENKNLINFTYATDNFFAELKQGEILQQRLMLLQAMDPFVGKYFDLDYAKKNVLRFTDEEIKKMNSNMQADAKFMATMQPAIGQDEGAPQ